MDYVLPERNKRANICSVALRMSHGTGGNTFPDLVWATHVGQKAMLYCSSINLTFRITVYLCHPLPAGKAQFKRIHTWTSITEPEHNKETIWLFRDDPRTTCLLATIVFGVGMNMLRNILTVTIINLPSSFNGHEQEKGCAVRNPVTAGTCILYIPTKLWDRLAKGKEPAARRRWQLAAATVQDNIVEPELLQYLWACFS
jgi:hypothetical protein